MIVIVSKEEKELIERLRKLEPVTALSEQVMTLRRELVKLEIDKAKQQETHDREERELRHMIGLEKKRQEVEMAQAKRDTTLTVREENLAAERKRFDEHLKFNTQRFESMEKYLKEMMGDILKRLPNVNMEIKRGR
jgi:hypothetical protein